jgi:hypothetical protein
MKSQVLSIALFMLTAMASGQNLVPNGSFEEYQDCPMTLDALYECDHWFSALWTPDYFNACNTGGLGVPSNIPGYQWAYHGQAYAGLVTFTQSSLDYREIIGVELVNALIEGENTYFSFWYSRGEDQAMSRASNNLGLKFCFDDDITNETLVNNQALMKVDTIVYDSLHWHRLKGSFTPQMAYTHLVIGNFFDDENTLSEPNGPGFSQSAYYYIDDVRVSPDSAFVNAVGLEKIRSIPQVKLYPTYSDDWIRLDGMGQYSRLQMISSQGIEVMRLENGKLPKEIRLSTHPSGMYFLRLEHSDGQIQVFKYFKK